MVKDAVCVFFDKLREENCIAELCGSDVRHCLPQQRTYLAQGREIVIKVQERRENMKCSSKELKARYQGERAFHPPTPQQKRDKERKTNSKSLKARDLNFYVWVLLHLLIVYNEILYVKG